MRRTLYRLLLCLLVIPVGPASGLTEYPVMLIPAALRRGSAMVVRDNQTTLEITGPSRYRKSVHLVVTLLNSKASELAELSVFYTSTTTVNSLKFKIYDEFGDEITRQFKTLKIADESATPEGTLYSDYRVRKISPVIARYPVTIEYSYQVTGTESPFYESWQPVPATEVALQAASLELVFPDNLRPRYKTLNGVADPVESNDGDRKKLIFQLHDLSPISSEPFAPPLAERAPCVLLAPGQFKIGNYSGAFNTWDDLGRFIGWLMTDRDILPAETVNRLKEITKESPDRRSKVKAIFRYMQNRTRYIGVQIGIGGWQPIPADYVDRKGYGDCKGLANYTRAMLKSIGIPSLYCLVNAGNHQSMGSSDFPDNNFNHVILCVPDGPDSLWLECTDPTIPFGFLGSFTQDRTALMITESGGILARTPSYTVTDNSSIRKSGIAMDSLGNVTVAMTTTNRCIQSEHLTTASEHSPDDQQKQFSERMGITVTGITCLRYSKGGDQKPVITETAAYNIPGYVSMSQSRYHIPVVFPDRKLDVYPPDTARNCDVVISSAFSDFDTAEIKLPKGISAEFIPGDKSFETMFGSYFFKAAKSSDRIQIVRIVTLKNGRYSPSDYSLFADFLMRIRKNDNQKIVLSRGR